MEGHMTGGKGLEIRRMYINVINKDDHCAFQYLIHFVCLLKMNQKRGKSFTCCKYCSCYLMQFIYALYLFSKWRLTPYPNPDHFGENYIISIYIMCTYMYISDQITCIGF